MDGIECYPLKDREIYPQNEIFFLVATDFREMKNISRKSYFLEGKRAGLLFLACLACLEGLACLAGLARLEVL